MINFEKELKNFEPSLEVEEAEAAIYNHDLTDVTDIITDIIYLGTLIHDVSLIFQVFTTLSLCN